MARKDQDKLNKSAQQQHAEETPDEVFMRFATNQHYNDQNNPIFEAGKVYPIKGRDWINRWLKRGGEIVEAPKEKEKVEKASSLPKSENLGDGTTNAQTQVGAEQVAAEKGKEENIPEIPLDGEGDQH
jgi:hypothetical protein